MSVFSVFNVGTGHTQHEKNNIMRKLYDCCKDPDEFKFINDGPIGVDMPAGTGMVEKKEATWNALVKAYSTHRGVKRVNLTGHSRGAILCHMIAHDILTRTSQIEEVNLFVIDPVHMSLESGHDGAKKLASNPRLKAYHAIVMQHVNSSMYPVTLVRGDNRETREKIYYIPMPGKHGSATQVLTNPISKVAFELIANFMSTRGTNLQHEKKSPEEMCELFAQIHLLNPLNVNGKRLIFDDGDVKYVGGKQSYKHTESYQPIKGRQSALNKIQSHNNKYAGGRVKFSTLDKFPYFFNQKHAKFFLRAFPDLWEVIVGNRIWDRVCASQEARLKFYPAMAATYHLLEPYMAESKIRRREQVERAISRALA